MRAFYSIPLLVILLLTTACGGGGDSGDSIIPLTPLTRDVYEGLETPALVNPVSAGLMFDFLFFGPSNPNAPSESGGTPVAAAYLSNAKTLIRTKATSQRSITVNETRACDNAAGIAQISGVLSDQGEGTLRVSYTNCLSGELNFDGDADITYSSVGGSSVVEISLGRVEMTGNGYSVRMSGSMVENEPSFSCGPTIMTSNLVIVDLNSSGQYKADNFVSETITCGIGSLGGEEVSSGRIYHSEYGYVDFTTEATLLYSDPELDFPDEGGELVIVGSGGSNAHISFITDDFISNNIVTNTRQRVRIEIDEDNDGVVDFEATMLPEDFSNGGGADIRDNDSDGMPNSWELIHSLNPEDPDDADSDSDNDSFSNYVEYIHFGDPFDSTTKPIHVDLLFEFRDATSSTRAGREQSLFFVITNTNQNFGARNIIFVITKTSNAEWLDIGQCTIDINDSNKLTCSLDYLRYDDARGFNVSVVSDDPTIIQLIGSVESDTYEPDTTNNTAIAARTIEQREARLGFKMGDFHDVAVIGKSHNYQIDVTHWGPDEARNAQLIIDTPDNLTVESATYQINFTSLSGVCDISIGVRCDLGNVAYNGASYKATIDLLVSGNIEGLANVTTTITSDAIDPEPENDQVTTEVFVGSSTETIQADVDSALDQSTVFVSPGMYVGGVNFNGKDVRLESISGVENTVVWPISPADTLSRSISVGPGGSISGFTFTGGAGVAIRLNGDGTIIENNIFSGGRDYYPGNIISGFSVYPTIRKNIFRANSDLSCNSIDLRGESSYLIENNLFNSPNCIAIASYNDFIDSTSVYHQVIANNTFINNEDAITVTKSNPFSEQSILNNIIVGSPEALRVVNLSPWVDTIEPTVINNIFFQNTTHSINYVVDTSLNMIDLNPQFIDALNDDYHLGLGSPAIDSGDGSYGTVNDLDGNDRPVDGDFDGFSNIDIGAYEYIP